MYRIAALIGAVVPLAFATAAGAQSLPAFDYSAATTTCSRSASATGTALTIGGGAHPMSAVLVAPSGSLRHAPAVLWVHWLGEVATTNHTEFEGDAFELAKHGVVSLLVDMPWSQHDWFASGRTTDDDYAATIDQVVALRRALDCLVALPGVDPNRIAYVGHDFGAMDGALLLAVDARPHYAVLMAPTLSFWEWYLLGAQPADRAAYVAKMSAFDLPGWLARGRQQATLLQFGQSDEYVAQATGIAIRNAVPDRDRTLKAYKLDHALDDDTARDDRRDWLVAHLTGP